MTSFLRTSLIIAIALLCGCDLIDYHPYDVNVKGKRNINATNAARIENAYSKAETVRFAVVSDTQGWYDDTKDFVKSVNSRNDVQFVIHLGDLSDYGTTQEFTLQRDILEKLAVPYVVCIGNHDCLGTGEKAFEAVFGEENFEFIASKVKFIMLNTNALEYDYGKAIPDFDFIEQCRTWHSGDFTRTVVAMHAKPFSDVFNNNVARIFQEEIKELPDLLFCLNGHDHNAEVYDLFNDGVLYYQLPNVAKRQYYIFTITPEGYTYETVSY